ncbi:MAG: ABC transporter substrate-binding protein [Propionibacteriaceae bacterium]|nr:ABC transporter substrate-binding protein [Propionibacteriaceae bacterium]
MAKFTLRATLAAAGTLALALTACGGTPTATETSPAAGDTPAASETTAAGAALETFTDGKFTVATGEPAYSPWVEDNAPESGKGFEAAVAYAVAEELGFAKEDVVWVRTTFDSAIAPGAKDWDVNIQQFTITDERKNAVDFSSPYYTTTQAVIALEGSPAAAATSAADLKDLAFGVQAGTTSAAVYEKAVQPSKDPLIFNSSQDTVQALKGNQVDAIVVDLPTALYLAAVEIEGGVVVGQFDDTEGGDEFGFVLPKGSALTAPVTAAVDAVRDAGTLKQLETEWLSDSIDVPVLK